MVFLEAFGVIQAPSTPARLFVNKSWKHKLLEIKDKLFNWRWCCSTYHLELPYQRLVFCEYTSSASQVLLLLHMYCGGWQGTNIAWCYGVFRTLNAKLDARLDFVALQLDATVQQANGTVWRMPQLARLQSPGLGLHVVQLHSRVLSPNQVRSYVWSSLFCWHCSMLYGCKWPNGSFWPVSCTIVLLAWLHAHIYSHPCCQAGWDLPGRMCNAENHTE